MILFPEKLQGCSLFFILVAATNNLIIYVGDRKNPKRFVCGGFPGPAVSYDRKEIHCVGYNLGNIITIEKNVAIKDTLALCEVAAFGNQGKMYSFTGMSDRF